MKVKLNPYINRAGKNLKSVMHNNQRPLRTAKPSKDTFVAASSRKKQLRDYLPMAEVIADYAKYGFKSANDAKLLVQYCLEKGLVYIPALALVLNMYRDMGGGEVVDADYCVKNGWLNFVNYMDSVKTNGKFDTQKLDIANKISNPFDYLKLNLNFEDVKLAGKDYSIISEALDNGAGIYFLIDAMHILNKEKKPYKNITKMLQLAGELKEINPYCSYMDNIAMNCYEAPEAAKTFYTPEITEVLDDVSPEKFYPDSINTALALKEKLFSIKRDNSGTLSSFIIATSTKDRKKHYLIDMKQRNGNLQTFVSTYEYGKNGQLLSVSDAIYKQVSENIKSGKTNFKDIITNAEISRVFDSIGSYVDIVKEQKIVKKSPDGELLRTEYYKQSKLPGMYDIFYSYPDGHVEVISRGVENPLTGEKVKKVNLKNENNVITNVFYKEDSAGNSEYKYNIADSSGTPLLARNVIRKVIDENRIISIIDGREYEILFKDDKIIISELTADGRQAKKYYLNVKSDAFSKIKRPSIIPSKDLTDSVKKVPAEFLINLIKNKLIIEHSGEETSCYLPKKNKICINPQVQSGFVLMHEGVHANDVEILGKHEKYNFSTDKSYRKIMKKELDKARSIEPSLSIERDMNYYFNIENKNRGEAELFADAGAIINTPPDVSTVSLRVFELMRNFPETIAKCAETAAKIFNVK